MFTNISSAGFLKDYQKKVTNCEDCGMNAIKTTTKMSLGYLIMMKEIAGFPEAPYNLLFLGSGGWAVYSFEMAKALAGKMRCRLYYQNCI